MKSNEYRGKHQTRPADQTGAKETFWHTFVSDRKRRYVHIYYVPYRDDEVLLFVYDLTDKHAQSESLDRLNLRYRALFERASKGILEGMPDRIRDCNQQICTMFGYRKSEFLKLTVDRLCHPHEFPELMALISHRPYRAAHDLEKSRAILAQEKGRLEPEIVDCLFRLLDKGLIGID